jgi:hypothetical protein
MEAKQKAKELVDRFSQYCDGSIDDEVFAAYDIKFGKGKRKFIDVAKFAKFYHAKQCALIAVDEIIKSSPSLPILSDNGTFGSDIEESTKYWNEVKEEIQKL